MYDMSNFVTEFAGVPMQLFVGSNDAFGASKDIDALTKNLPKST